MARQETFHRVVQGLGFRVSGSWFNVPGSGFWDSAIARQGATSFWDRRGFERGLQDFTEGYTPNTHWLTYLEASW